MRNAILFVLFFALFAELALAVAIVVNNGPVLLLVSTLGFASYLSLLAMNNVLREVKESRATVISIDTERSQSH